MDKPKKIDPIQPTYYGPLQTAETASDWVFYIGAVFSLATLLVDKAKQPDLYDIVHAVFIVLVVLGWAIGLTVRVYFSPRAQDRRLKDFLGHAFGVQLAPTKTEGYYNTTAEGDEGVGSRLMENAYHSKDTATRMAWVERAKVLVFALLLLFAVLHRRTDLNFIAIVAQAIFSEQLLSRWIRLEWLRDRFETVFDELFKLFTARPNQDKFKVMILELLIRYETAKANAAITLSSRIFAKRNEAVSKEWEEIRIQLRL